MSDNDKQIKFLRSVSETTCEAYVEANGMKPFLVVDTDGKDGAIMPLDHVLAFTEIMGRYYPFFILGTIAKDKLGSDNPLSTVLMAVEASFLSGKDEDTLEDVLDGAASVDEHPDAKHGIVFACMSAERTPHIIIYEIVSGNDLIKFYDSTESEINANSAHFAFLEAFLDGYKAGAAE